jgi:ureidoacrylate peracid hydrolase
MPTESPSTVSFDSSRTAVLVIDPVNDFLHEDGAAWEMPSRR